jgi:hypothetical protein
MMESQARYLFVARGAGGAGFKIGLPPSGRVSNPSADGLTNLEQLAHKVLR